MAAYADLMKPILPTYTGATPFLQAAQEVTPAQGVLEVPDIQSSGCANALGKRKACDDGFGAPQGSQSKRVRTQPVYSTISGQDTHGVLSEWEVPNTLHPPGDYMLPVVDLIPNLNGLPFLAELFKTSTPELLQDMQLPVTPAIVPHSFPTPLAPTLPLDPTIAMSSLCMPALDVSDLVLPNTPYVQIESDLQFQSFSETVHNAGMPVFGDFVAPHLDMGLTLTPEYYQTIDHDAQTSQTPDPSLAFDAATTSPSLSSSLDPVDNVSNPAKDAPQDQAEPGVQTPGRKKQYFCYIDNCQDAFGCISSRYDHMRTHFDDPDVPQTRAPCPYCGLVYSRRDALTRHWKATPAGCGRMARNDGLLGGKKSPRKIVSAWTLRQYIHRVRRPAADDPLFKKINKYRKDYYMEPWV